MAEGTVFTGVCVHRRSAFPVKQTQEAEPPPPPEADSHILRGRLPPRRHTLPKESDPYGNTVNERSVHILLEYILVSSAYHFFPFVSFVIFKFDTYNLQENIYLVL